MIPSKLRLKLKKATVGMTTAIASTQLFVAQALASTPTDAAAVLNGAGNNASVDKIGNAAKGVVSSVVTGATNIGVTIAVIALIVGLIRWGFNRNSQKRESGKDSIIWACIALFVLGGAIALVGAALQVGANARV